MGSLEGCEQRDCVGKRVALALACCSDELSVGIEERTAKRAEQEVSDHMTGSHELLDLPGWILVPVCGLPYVLVSVP